MPYIDLDNDTFWPSGSDKDLEFLIALIEEKYHRFYPEIKYFRIDYHPTSNDGKEGMAGDPPGTAVDPLYGEAVPSSAVHDGWHQPHSEDNDDNPRELKKYLDPILIYADIHDVKTDISEGFKGSDRMRKIQVILASSLLDAESITVKPGDYLEWDGYAWDVLEIQKARRFKRTDIYLYQVLNAVRRRSTSQ